MYVFGYLSVFLVFILIFRQYQKLLTGKGNILKSKFGGKMNRSCKIAMTFALSFVLSALWAITISDAQSIKNTESVQSGGINEVNIGFGTSTMSTIPINIQFNTPYQYQDGKLVIMALSHMNTQLYEESANEFYITEGLENYSNDLLEPDPTNLPLEMQVANDYPNIPLHFRDLVTVYGRVVSIFPSTIGIEGAIITLANIQTYSVSTNANGEFTILGVVSDQTYNYTITSAGYQPVSGTIAIASNNSDMGTIVMTQMLDPVTNVVATIANSNVLLTWEAPGNQSMSDTADDRRPVQYKVYRLLVGQENNQAIWTSLTASAIQTLSYSDSSWSILPQGEYVWAVVAEYSEGMLSAPTFSNQMIREINGTISGTVANWNSPISGARVSAGMYYSFTNASGIYTMTVPTGIYSVTCYHYSYVQSSQNNVEVNAIPEVTTVNFTMNYANNLFEDSFDYYPDFALEFGSWTVRDIDMQNPYVIPGHSWLNATEHQAFIIFNPTATIPPLVEAEPHTGTKYAACFDSAYPNNDWLITTRFFLDSWSDCHSFSFWAKSYTAQYGLERIKVGVSTTGNLPADFIFISEEPYVEVPTTWTQYSYSIVAYQNQYIYLTIQCVSNNAMMLMIDDVVLSSAVSNQDPLNMTIVNSLHGNYPNPFNPNTTIKYSVKKASPVSITIYNLKGQLVKTLVDEIMNAGEYNVLWNGTDDSNRSVTSGVYFCNMKAGQYTSTRKMILLK